MAVAETYGIHENNPRRTGVINVHAEGLPNKYFIIAPA